MESDEEADTDYDLDVESYRPVRSISNHHGVMVVPHHLANLPQHCLQCMHHGTTAIRLDSASSHSAMCNVRLENDNAVLSWGRPDWSALQGGSATMLPDYVLKGEQDLKITPGLSAKYQSGIPLIEDVDEGYIDLIHVKEVSMTCGTSDLSVLAKRHGLENLTQEDNCITLLYGSHIAENKVLEFVFTNSLAKIWFQGLTKLVRGARLLQKRQSDRRIQWLKEQYLQLYFDSDKCQGPNPAEAIRVCSSVG